MALKKPTTSETVLAFAEGNTGKGMTKKATQKAQKQAQSGLVPEGDTRLTANIKSELHIKLKMKAVQDRTTIGEIIEDLIRKHL